MSPRDATPSASSPSSPLSRAAAALLDRHTDADHNRSVFTLAAAPGSLRSSLVSGAGGRAGADRHDPPRGPSSLHRRPRRLPRRLARSRGPRGRHRRGPARWPRRSASSASPSSPTASWPALPSAPSAPSSAAAGRRSCGGGWRAASSAPDWGPPRLHPRAGATLVTARPPLAAFNVVLEGGDEVLAREIAAELRESGGGLPGVRAIGLLLSGGRAQVSTNVHDPLAVPLAVGGRADRRAGRRPQARGRWRPSWSAWFRRPRSRAIPTMCRFAASTPIEAGDRAGPAQLPP